MPPYNTFTFNGLTHDGLFRGSVMHPGNRLHFNRLPMTHSKVESVMSVMY